MPPRTRDSWFVLALSLLIVAMVLATCAMFTPAHSYSGFTQFLKPHALYAAAGAFNPYAKWMNSLMQPNNPGVSCCGEADAFEADDFMTGPEGEYVAIITDGRGVLPDGTPIRIPNAKLRLNTSNNPTGHGWVFLHVNGEGDTAIPGTIMVYCYEPPAGI